MTIAIYLSFIIALLILAITIIVLLIMAHREGLRQLARIERSSSLIGRGRQLLSICVCLLVALLA